MIPTSSVPSAKNLVLSVTAGLLATLAPVQVVHCPLFRPDSLGDAPYRKSSLDTPHRSQQLSAAHAVPTLATLVNLHTKEIRVLTQLRPSQAQFSHFLRDRITGQQIAMAPALLALLRRLNQPTRNVPRRVEFISGYRSWKFNEHLRKKGHHVASHSQHSLGHAMDFRIEGLSSKQLANQIEHFRWRGGLAFYPGATDRFVHVDVGPNRRWKGR